MPPLLAQAPAFESGGGFGVVHGRGRTRAPTSLTRSAVGGGRYSRATHEPKATTDAALPSFVFFGLCIIATGVVYAFVATETNKRSLESISVEAARGDAAAS